MAKLPIIVSLLYLFVKCSTADECIPRNYNKGGTVCVCNETYCDYLGKIPRPIGRNVHVYESNEAGARFKKSVLSFKNDSPKSLKGITLAIDRNKLYQEILGFGGAFTDAAGINMKSLPAHMTDHILRSYFSKEGLTYNIGRVPMASCDFSTWNYSYDDIPGDLELRHFNLVEEDLEYKIPLIQKASALTSDRLLLFGSPWSSPFWMKTNENMAGVGTIKGKPGGLYYKAWAKYFVKFLKAYESHNITFWGLTAQNEPVLAFSGIPTFQILAFSPEMQKQFIKLDLGPALQASGHGPEKIKLMIGDDQRIQLPHIANKILSDPEASKYISGVAVHWYADKYVGPEVLEETHETNPDKFILYTEASNTGNNEVLLGNWQRGEAYAQNILEDLTHWSVGWVDWNLALDLQGGPNWVQNFVDSPIIVDKKRKEFYKQPMYYCLAHFSKFLKRGSRRIRLDVNSVDGIEAGAFETPEGCIVTVVLNRNPERYEIQIKYPELGIFSSNISPHSVQTYVWRA